MTKRRKTAGLMLAALAGLGLAGPAWADVINGSFETGTLSGWTANDPAKAVVSGAIDFRRNPIAPTHGGFQMELTAGQGAGVASTLSQALSVSQFGLLRFDVAFAAHDVMPFNDSAYFKLDGATLGTISVSDVGDLGGSGYLTVQVPISAGEHALEFGILDGEDDRNPSKLYVDNILIMNIGPPPGSGGEGGLPIDRDFDRGDAIANPAPTPNPEPSSLALLGLGLAGLAGYGVKRRKKTAA